MCNLMNKVTLELEPTSLGSASVSLFLLSPLGDELDQTYPLEAATKSSTGVNECGEVHLKCSLLKMEMSNVQLAKCRQAFESFDADGYVL